MFPSAPPPNHHVQFALKSSVRITPPSTPPKLPSLIYPQIAKSDLPSNRLYDLPPRNRQVRFTPQIVCTIYPPEIAKSDLPSNRQVRFTPDRLYNLPPQIAREDLPLKSPSTIYPPSNHPILSKISNAHNIMLCFTKVFSAKDQ